MTIEARSATAVLGDEFEVAVALPRTEEVALPVDRQPANPQAGRFSDPYDNSVSNVRTPFGTVGWDFGV